MLIQIIINYICGLTLGFIFEFVYRRVFYKNLERPKLINFQMYGLTAIFLYIVFLFDLHYFYNILLALIFTTGIEFMVGYSYLKRRKIHLWDYSAEPFNYKGIISPRFSLYWLVISLLYFYSVIPVLIKI